MVIKFIQNAYLFFSKRRDSQAKTLALPANEEASILVICIWLLLSLSLLSITVGKIVYSQINFSRFYINRTQSYFLAKAAVKEAMVERAYDMTPSFDTLYELQTPRDITFEQSSVRYTLTDESSKININHVDSEILAELFDSNFLADDIIDYRNHKPFLTIRELLNMDEVDERDFEKIKEFITVNSTGKVNINTVPEEVLLALGCDAGACEKIIGYRQGEDGEEATLDDMVFDSSETISTVFEDLAINCNKEKLFVTESQYYTLNASPAVGARTGDKIEAIISSSQVKSWRKVGSSE